MDMKICEYQMCPSGPQTPFSFSFQYASFSGLIVSLDKVFFVWEKILRPSFETV